MASWHQSMHEKDRTHLFLLNDKSPIVDLLRLGLLQPKSHTDDMTKKDRISASVRRLCQQQIQCSRYQISQLNVSDIVTRSSPRGTVSMSECPSFA